MLLGDVAVVIAHDDCYGHLPQMTPEQAAVYDFDCPGALETSLPVEHLHALAAGEPARVPSFDFVTHARDADARLVEPARIAILEGLFVMCDVELAPVITPMLIACRQPGRIPPRTPSCPRRANGPGAGRIA